MLNLDETLEVASTYNTQRDLLFKTVFSSLSAFVILDLIREQLPEIDILQLIPGYYLILLFVVFLLVIFITDFFLRVPFEIENGKSFGTKTITKLTISLALKASVLFLYLTILESFTTVIPIGLDSFNSYGEKTLENVWSIDEVVNLEVSLILILILISQVPAITITIIDGQTGVILLKKYWRAISLSTFVISGILTPTVDGYTQLSFSAFGLLFYLVIIIISLRRVIISDIGSANLGF